METIDKLLPVLKKYLNDDVKYNKSNDAMLLFVKGEAIKLFSTSNKFDVDIFSDIAAKGIVTLFQGIKKDDALKMLNEINTDKKLYDKIESLLK